MVIIQSYKSEICVTELANVFERQQWTEMHREHTTHEAVDDRIDGAVEVAQPVWHQRQVTRYLARW